MSSLYKLSVMNIHSSLALKQLNFSIIILLQKTFCEPSFIICASATEDTQAIKESSLSGVPIIAFADSTSNLKCVDIPIPCNTLGRLSIAAMHYLLARQTLRHKGKLSYQMELENLTPDHFLQPKASKSDEVVEEEDVADKTGGQRATANDNDQYSNMNAMDFEQTDYQVANMTVSNPNSNNNTNNDGW